MHNVNYFIIEDDDRIKLVIEVDVSPTKVTKAPLTKSKGARMVASSGKFEKLPNDMAFMLHVVKRKEDR